MNDINYVNWKSYYIKNSIIDYNLKNTEHIRLFNTNDFTLKPNNINYMNPYLGEMVMLYYIWKNNLKSDYIIISQYRRDFVKIQWDKIINNSIQVIIKGYSNESIINRLLKCSIDPQLIIHIEKYLANKKGISLSDMDEIFHKNGHDIFFIICFVCKWDIFCNICEFIFDIFNYLLPNNGWKNTNVYEIYRNNILNNLTQNNLINENNNNVLYPRYFAFIIEIILGSCLPILFDIFEDDAKTSKNIYCNINNVNHKQLIKFYHKNLALLPKFNFIYDDDKIKFDNESYYIKEKNNYVKLFEWDYMNYRNIKFINSKQVYKINNNDIILNINEYIDSESIEDFINGKYDIKNIDETKNTIFY